MIQRPEQNPASEFFRASKTAHDVSIGMFSLQTTEDQLLSTMLDGITQEMGADAWQKTDPEYMDFAEEKYLSETCRIGLENGNGQQYIMYIRGYARRKDDLMVFVMIFADGTTIDETEQRLDQIVSCYRKA